MAKTKGRWIQILAISLVLLLVLYAGLQMLYPLKYREEIESAAGEYGVPTSLIAAIIKTESGYRARVVSEKNAYGLMQVTESTGIWIRDKIGRDDAMPDGLLDPEVNIQYGTWYMRYLLNKYDQEDLALIAYNAGPGTVDRWLSDGTITPDDLSEIPYGETAEYHVKTKRIQAFYRLMYRLDDRLEEE